MALESELGGYAIVEKLAIGGMAEVYRARAGAGTQRSTDEPPDVVLKRLLPQFRANQAYINAFVQEGKLCVRLKHANLVRTFKVFKKGMDYFMVQDLVDGRSLGAIHERARGRGIPVGVAGAVFAVRELVRALEYVHKLRYGEGPAATVHGDINPANLLVARTGEVKLTDFGVAMPEGSPAHGEGGTVRGTLTHMAPEQVLGKPIDRRADLFSAGVILWELLANRQLVDAKNEYDAMQRSREARVPLLSTLRSDLPDLLVQIVRKSVFSDPALRFQEAGEFANALDVLGRRSNLRLGPDTLAPEAT
jgi:serine/threonine-protein kinase